MDNVLSVPAERELPPGSAVRMRTRLIAEISPPAVRRGRRRLAIASATAAVMAVTGVVGAGLASGTRHPAPASLLAMGPAEVSGGLTTAVSQCLTWAARPGMPVRVTRADLAVAAERGGRGALLFLTDAGYVTCEVDAVSSDITGGGIGANAWRHRDWLPGPVERLLLSSTERASGDVAVSGRVSARVSRLTLEWPGHTIAARIDNGAFGLLSPVGAGVTGDAQLVAYDATGQEIDRRPLFVSTDELGRCYVDPAGNVLYGNRGPDCRAADPWSPRH